mgnify:CR=1 FL=1
MSERNEETLYLGLKKIFGILRERFLLVIFVAVLAALGTVIGHINYTPMYTSESSVEIQSTGEQPSLSMVLTASPFSGLKNDSSKLINHIKSMNFMMTVAQAIKFDGDPRPLVLVTADNMSGKCTQFSFSLPSPLSFETWKRKLSSLHKSTGVRTPELSGVEPLRIPLDRLACFLEHVTSVSANGDLVTIGVTTFDGYTSMKLANIIANSLADYMNSREIDSLKEIEKLMSSKLIKAKQTLNEKELALIDFQKRNQGNMVSGPNHPIATQLNQTNAVIQDLQLKTEENQSLIHYYNGQLNQLTEGFVDNEQQTVVVNTAGQITHLQDRIDALKKNVDLYRQHGTGEDDWRVTEGKEELIQLTQELVRLKQNSPASPLLKLGLSPKDLRDKITSLGNANEGFATKLASLQKAKDSLLKQMSHLPAMESQSIHLKTQVSMAFEQHSLLVKKLNELEFQQISLKSKASINRLSDLPTERKRLSLVLKLVFASLTGLFFGSLISLFLHFLDPSIRDAEAVTQMGIMYLGSVSNANKDSKVKADFRSFIVDEKPIEHIIEFEQICSLLDAKKIQPSSDSQVILVTSSRPGEGKSFISSNLAQCMAQMGKKTLLLDCDLRQSTVHIFWGMTNDRGLSDVIEGKELFDRAVNREVVANLDILTSGWKNINPSMIISNEKFRILIKHLRKRYETIVIDSPPINLLADATILSGVCDNTLVVAAYGRTTRYDLKEVQYRLQTQAKKNLLGIINFAPRNTNHLQYRNYYSPKANSLELSSTENELKGFESQFNEISSQKAKKVA